MTARWLLAALMLLTACANAPTAPTKRPTPPTIEPPRIYPDTPTVRP